MKGERPSEAYIVGIDDWSWEYGFGIQETEGAKGPEFMEFDGIEILGTIKRPAKLRDWRINLIVWPYAGYNGKDRTLADDRRTGWLDSLPRDKLITGGVRLPENKLAGFLAVLASGRWEGIDIDGTPLVKREADILGFRMLKRQPLLD